MLGKTVLSFPPLEEGILLKRYKRFLADVQLDSGEVVTAHCANTGPMKGVLQEGGRVRLRYAPSPNRKLDWSWEQSQVTNPNSTKCWVGINTSLPNTLVRLAIEEGFLNKELGDIGQIRREVVYGANRKSRIDLLLTPAAKNPDTRLIYLEVKNTTWTDGTIALFPDSVTKRGQKHLQELIEVIPQFRGVLVPCLSRSDVNTFAPGDIADPCYGELFRIAVKSGVEIIPCCFGFHRDQITWEGKRPLDEKQKLSIKS